MSQTEPGGAVAARPRVAVVFGGRSSEHAVSCATAAGVLRAIDRTRYDVLPVGIATDGRWVLVPDEPAALALGAGHVPTVDAVAGDAVLAPLSAADPSLTVLAPGRPPEQLGRVDVVFPLLHGPFGEDGTIQGLLELSDTRYVGSGVLASAVMMDKHVMKLILAAHQLPVGAHVVIPDAEWRRDPQACLDAAASLGFPLFVKPCRAGSSMGISKVGAAGGLEAAVEAARRHDPKVLVEAAVVGREIECGVLQGRDGGPPRVSEVGEIQVVRGHEFYDYEAKYLAGSDVRLTCPADLPAGVRDRARELAGRAFEAAGCEGLARVDFFYTQEGDVLVNEVNTMPGFTPLSMFPMAWAASGMSYEDLVEELLQLALARPVGLR